MSGGKCTNPYCVNGLVQDMDQNENGVGICGSNYPCPTCQGNTEEPYRETLYGMGNADVSGPGIDRCSSGNDNLLGVEDLNTAYHEGAKSRDAEVDALKSERDVLRQENERLREALLETQIDPAGMPWWHTLQELIGYLNEHIHPLDYPGHLHERLVDIQSKCMTFESALAQPKGAQEVKP